MCQTIIISLSRYPPNPANDHLHSHSAVLLENLGDLESWKGNYEQDGNASGVANVLKQAAVSCRNSYRGKVYGFASTALEKCRCLDDHLAIAAAFLWVGSSLTAQGRAEEAMSLLQEKESLEVFQCRGHDIGIVKASRRWARSIGGTIDSRKRLHSA
ncbi:hypothetical protein FRC00_005032 [Tulasnella sp. 408]|nr:hypothetical protein FRC00_005032 [Tulasnella sp. 408]